MSPQKTNPSIAVSLSLRTRLPQLLLALFLHVMPVCKVLQSPALEFAASPVAIVLKWAAALAAMAGAYHTVSAASAAIVGLTKYTNNTPLGGPTNHAVVAESGVFRYRITVSNAGSDHKKDYFNCLPMPPGLSMNTNIGGNGFITNAPNSSLVAGVYRVRLYAGNTSYPDPVTYDATITVLGAGVAPSIVTQPVSQTVAAGQSATFTVTAGGTAPVTYQWRFNAVPLAGQTNASLTLSPVTEGHAGAYSVVASNGAGSVTSENAVLTVLRLAPLTLENPRISAGGFTFEVAASGGRAVLWRSADLGSWQALSTNTPVAGRITFSDPLPGDRQFYQATSVP